MHGDARETEGSVFHNTDLCRRWVHFPLLLSCPLMPTQPAHPFFSRAAQSFIERATAAARGWKIIGPEQHEVDGDPLYLYVHDVDTSFTWMARVNFSGFMAAASKVREDGEEVQAIVAAHLGVVLGDLVQKRAQIPTPHNADAMDALIAGDLSAGLPGLFQLATLQAGASSMVFEDGLLAVGGHFVLLRYCTPEDVHLRTLVLPPEVAGSKGIMDVDMLAQVLSSIIRFDQQHLREIGI